eukprot:7736-Lingulodinium_polyedra.AAC.1
MPLLRCSWARAWHPVAVATDACESGYGVCVSWWGAEATAAAGRVPERSRFKRAPGHSARDAFFERHGFVKDAAGQWTPFE